jgi:hypothetical protein
MAAMPAASVTEKSLAYFGRVGFKKMKRVDRPPVHRLILPVEILLKST